MHCGTQHRQSSKRQTLAICVPFTAQVRHHGELVA